MLSKNSQYLVSSISKKNAPLLREGGREGGRVLAEAPLPPLSFPEKAPQAPPLPPMPHFKHRPLMRREKACLASFALCPRFDFFFCLLLFLPVQHWGDCPSCYCCCRTASTTSSLQMGHCVLRCRSHVSMCCWWKRCRHGSTRTRSPAQ